MQRHRSEAKMAPHFILMCAVLFVAVLFLGTSVKPVTAEDEGLQAQSSAHYTFGQSMYFSLRAKSVAPITGATLFFNTPEMEGTYAVDFDFDASSEVALAHDLSLTQVQLAPFTTVRYWWRLSTEAGTELVEEQTLDYVDDRFAWQSQENEGIEIFWTGDDRTLGQAALDVIEAAHPGMESVLPVEMAPLRVFIYPSMADLRSALRLTGRDWVGAEAMPELGLLLVTAVNPRTAALDLGRSIPHELSHLLFYRITGAQYEESPRWFDEGLATSLQLTQDSGYADILREAVHDEATIPFANLCRSFPAGEDEVRLAYAQSASLVSYVQQEYGLQALRALVQAFADGAGCEGGVRRVLGKSMTDLESEWLRYERPVSPVIHFLRESGLWVALAGASFVIMSLMLIPLGRR